MIAQRIGSNHNNAQKVTRMKRTSVLDADIFESEVSVCVKRHKRNMENLAEEVGERVVATLQQHPTGSFYFNPIVTVSHPEPTEEFFRIVRREQSRWCRQAASTFPRRLRRRQSNWVSGGEWIKNKDDRYLDRALCFTGILYINGKMVRPHEWPESSHSQRRSTGPKLMVRRGTHS